MAPPQKSGGNASEKMDDWIAVLNPEVNSLFAQPPGQAEDGGGGVVGMGNMGGSVMRADSEPSGSVKAGVEVEVKNKELPPYSGKYGKITGSCTVKITVSAGAGGKTGLGADFKGTVKDKKDGRTPGMKVGFSDKDIGDLDLFKGLSLNSVDIGVEGELSGTEVSVSGTFKFNIVTSRFNAPAQAKLTLVKVKLGESIKVAAIELKVAPKEFPITIAGVEYKATAEFKVTFEVDWKKIGLEIVEKIAKKKLKEEAEKQGVKLLSREAAEAVLKDLGPLAAAFSVGLDIGALLNAYTVAPKVAGAVDDAILGDLNERYQRADTLGKMWLLSKNSPRIVAALVASGVAGAVSGMADVVLFKIMGLPGAKDYEEAFERFSAGIHEMGKVLTLTRDNIQKIGPGSMAYGAFVLGIKTNPKHAMCADESLDKIIAAIFAKIHPLYKPNGINEVIAVRVGNVGIDQALLEKFASFVLDSELQTADDVELADAKSLAESWKEMLIAQFLAFLENNQFIGYNVKIGDNSDADAIDEKLLKELYAGTPLEQLE